MRTQTFIHRSTIPAPAKSVLDYHCRDGAIHRLTPPWEKVELLEQSGPFADRRVTLRLKIGPVWRTWVARHQDYVPGVSFTDVQVQGPFAFWKHTHTVKPLSSTRCELIDQVEYALPGGLMGRLLAGAMTRKQLDRMFRYRHQVTQLDVLHHQAAAASQPSQQVLVTGATGFVGSALIPLLTTGGHRVTRLVRSQPSSSCSDVVNLTWDDFFASYNRYPMDAVIHLAGESILGRWTPAKKELIRSSRVDLTRKLCQTLATQPHKPKVLLCAAAIGYYGDRGDDILTERDPMGDGFLAQVGRDWEAACEPARQAGIRIVNLRIGVVLSPTGAALRGMLLPFQLGVGGPISHGRQYWSWIALDDLLYLILHAIHNPALEGPVNAVAPNPVTNRVFTQTLGRVLRRPTLLPAPAWALKLLMGEVADFATASQRVIPQRLLETGYPFAYPELEPALRHLLGK